MSDITLRSYVFLDNLQPQLASFVGTTARGYIPIPGVASLFIEIAPGLAINQLMDVALKATRCTPAVQVVERAYGLLEVHHQDQGEVKSAGAAVLGHLGISEEARIKPRVVSNQIIRSIEAYQSQIINRNRYGMMLLASQSLFIFETEPAAYVVYAANEAEKAADVNLVDLQPFGAFGRLYMGGSEAEIDSAAEAAQAAVASLEGVELKVRKA